MIRYFAALLAVLSLAILGVSLAPQQHAGMINPVVAAGNPPDQIEATLTPSPVPTCGWIQLPSTDPSRYAAVRGMAAPAANDVWAVGSAITHWDGNRWSHIANFGSDLELAAVSAVSANDVWVVGKTTSYTLSQTLIAHYDGSPTWSIVPSPNIPNRNNALTGVAARTATDIWAVGTYRDGNGIVHTLILHYDGSLWSIIPSPDVAGHHNYLTAITAIAANDVWAVGYHTDTGWPLTETNTLTLHWDGVAWSIVPSPNSAAPTNAPGDNSALYAVAGTAANDVWAVGHSATTTGLFTLHWNGTQWSRVPSGSGAGRILRGVVALAPNDVWAVGSNERALTAHWDGTSWTEVPAADPGPAYYSGLAAITAVGPNDIWAGGLYEQGSFDGVLVEHRGVCIYPPSATASPTPTRTFTPAVPPAPLPCGVSTRFSEGFESGFGAFTHNPQDPWGLSGWAHTGSTSAFIQVPEVWDRYAWITTTMPITIPANAEHATLSAWYITASDDDSPGGEIQASTDGGSTWTGVLGFVYHTLTWVQVTTSFDAYIGRSILLRMGGHYFGPYGTWLGVDDIQLTLVNNTGPGCPTLTPTPTFTRTPTITPTIAHTPHAGQFEDVPPGSTFYDYVECMGTRAIIGGYPCGSPGEPCFNPNKPYFRPNNNVTRGQASKMISLSANLTVPPLCDIQFVDVPTTNPFYPYARALVCHDIVSGYPCGGPGEPCPGLYFRPNNNLTRGQLAKMDSLAAGFTATPTSQTFEDVAPGSTFYPFIQQVANRGIVGGYPCGGPFEPCVPPMDRPYFRPTNNVTRGQTAKIITNSFFPGCQNPTPTATATATRTPTVTVTPPNTPVVVTATPPEPCGPGWDREPDPGGILYDVAAAGVNDIWAVGMTDYAGRTLAVHWDGTTWAVVPSPDPSFAGSQLAGVAAVAANDIWAVGSQFGFNGWQTLIMHWDGGTWTVVPSPNVGTYNNFLGSVAAVASNNVWAVGASITNTSGDRQTLVLHWDGTTWAVVSSPNIGTNDFLTAIAASAANDIWAVGYNQGVSGGQTLVERWDGASWTIVPSLNGILNDVAVAGPNDVWAVGGADIDSTTTLIQHWNGTNWAVVPSPNLGPRYNWLAGVEAKTATDIWAVGSYDNGTGYNTFTLHWDGTSWTIVPSPNADTNNRLEGVVAVAANDVWAVGNAGNNSNNNRIALTEHYAPLPCITSTPTPIPTPSVTVTGTPLTPTPTPTRASQNYTATPTGTPVPSTPTVTVTPTP